jgi:hypothetical protein
MRQLRDKAAALRALAIHTPHLASSTPVFQPANPTSNWVDAMTAARKQQRTKLSRATEETADQEVQPLDETDETDDIDSEMADRRPTSGPTASASSRGPGMGVRM